MWLIRVTTCIKDVLHYNDLVILYIKIRLKSLKRFDHGHGHHHLTNLLINNALTIAAIITI